MESGLTQQDEKNSLQHQFSKSREKDLFPRGSRNVNLLDKVPSKIRGRTTPDQHVSTEQVHMDLHATKGRSTRSPLGIPQKPWPSRKVTRDDELVKHMSHVPHYLQRSEKGENIQEKALNVGVLDWALLERWAHYNKCVSHGGNGEIIPHTTETMIFSAYESSNKHSLSMPILQGNPSHSSYLHSRSPAAKGDKTQSSGKEKYGHVSSFNDSETLHNAFSSQHKNHSNVFGLNTQQTVDVSGKGGRGHSDVKSMHERIFPHPCSQSSYPAAKKHDASPKKMTNSQVNRSRERGENQHNRRGINDMEEKDLLPTRISFGSSLLDDRWLIERNMNYMLFNFSEDVEFNQQRVPHSCPLPCTIRDGEPDITNIHVLPPNQSSDVIEQSIANKTQKSGQGVAKETITGGTKQSNNLFGAGSKWMKRSSSLKEGLSKEEHKSFAPFRKTNADEGNRNTKGRRSPLRRMLDPLLKSKNNLPSSSQASTSCSHRSHEIPTSSKILVLGEMEQAYSLSRPSNTDIDLIYKSKGITNFPIQTSNNCARLRCNGNHAPPVRHALLQLAWKNGLPLFMLSSSDNDVLAATISPKSTTTKDELECIYTIYSVHESKKKKTLWVSPGKKDKKHHLVSNIVGKMKVSESKLKRHDPHNHVSTKEFVFLSTEVEPKCQDFDGNDARNELAAIVIKSPEQEIPENSSNASCNPTCGVPSATNSKDDTCLCNKEKLLVTDQESDSIVVILPNGLHGSSTDAEPSPLIQRWRSDGACDCGGWDEGCPLTIITNDSPEWKGPGAVQIDKIEDDTNNRLELFIQGGSREKCRVFNMIAFKEGFFAIEYKSSFELLQAFAVCIAILHNGKLQENPAEVKSLDNKFNDEKATRPSGAAGGHSSYVPNCPVSPVRRA